MTPRFLADKTVGRLAKWLRLLGFDCEFRQDDAWDDLVDLARNENRILISKNTRLQHDKDLPESLFIESDHGEEQLKQVLKYLSLIHI